MTSSVSEDAVHDVVGACDALSSHLDSVKSDVDQLASATVGGFGSSPDGKKMEQKLHEYTTTGCKSDGLKSSAEEQKKTIESYKGMLRQGYEKIKQRDELAARGMGLGVEAGGAGADGRSVKGGKAGNPAAQAKQFLGMNAEQLKKMGIGMDPGVSSHECCANFVSAMLQREGLTNFHTDSVADLSSRLQSSGWHTFSGGEPPVGAVVIVGGGQHTEIYAGNGQWIGSNNTNADGSQQVGFGRPYGSFIYLVPPGY